MQDLLDIHNRRKIGVQLISHRCLPIHYYWDYDVQTASTHLKGQPVIKGHLSTEAESPERAYDKLVKIAPDRAATIPRPVNTEAHNRAQAEADTRQAAYNELHKDDPE